MKMIAWIGEALGRAFEEMSDESLTADRKRESMLVALAQAAQGCRGRQPGKLPSTLTNVIDGLTQLGKTSLKSQESSVKTCCQLFGWLPAAGPIDELHQQWLDVGYLLGADDPFVGMQLTDVLQEVPYQPRSASV